jgi:hypothetical protein
MDKDEAQPAPVPDWKDGVMEQQAETILWQAKRIAELLDQQAAQLEQEPCGWQFYQDGKWHNGMETNNHRANTEAAGIPVRDVYPAPQRTWVGSGDLEDSNAYQTPPAQPAVPDAITDNSETPEYIQGWNDCRVEMLKGRA